MSAGKKFERHRKNAVNGIHISIDRTKVGATPKRNNHLFCIVVTRIHSTTVGRFAVAVMKGAFFESQ